MAAAHFSEAGDDDGQDGAVNERVADAIEREWSFRLQRLPADVVASVGLTVLVLAGLEVLLVISNNAPQPLGFWAGFVRQSAQYRDRVSHSSLGHRLHLDARWLNPYSLWRGWAVPSLLAGTTYIAVALLTLRVELYHWKPALLAHYMAEVRASRIGQRVPVPAAWLDAGLYRLFLLYADKHRQYTRQRLQKTSRPHRALRDAQALAHVLRVVAGNIALSSVVLLAFWVLLLSCTGIESHDIAQLPRSYVPPLQGLVWYMIDDGLYFYPHWMAHLGGALGRPRRTFTQPQTRAKTKTKSSPRQTLRACAAWALRPLARRLNAAHKMHHRSRANLGIAAWYCSPLEQVCFNLAPVLAGPFLTQVLADRLSSCGVFGFTVQPGVWNTHLVTLYVWLMAGAAMSVLGHTGYRSRFNDPGKHDLHHERALDTRPGAAVNFGTMGLFDWLHGTGSAIPREDAHAWRRQRTRQAALNAASQRTGIALTAAQQDVVQQPDHGQAWTGKTI